MKNKVIKKVVPQFALNSLNLLLVERTVTENYELHFHDLYEIEFVISGECIQYINGSPIECRAGSVIFVTPMDMHSMEISGPVEIININFEINCIDSDLRSLCDRCMYTHNLPDIYLNLLCDEFNSELRYNLFFQKHLLNCIMTQIVRCAEDTRIGSTNNLALEIARYIQSHFADPISLSSLSQIFGYTPNYLSNQFHKYIGRTIKQFILDTRLERAAKNLLTTSNSVTDICYASGFTSLSNFLRAFKSKYGKSPNSYRSSI